MKIPFTLNQWLKDKSQKVETRDGRPVRIICTDRKFGYPIIALAYNKDEDKEVYINADNSGKAQCESKDDLFLITPEEELSEFEQYLKSGTNIYVEQGRHMEDWDAKEDAKELLALAREQFIKDGYVIEKKAFHDAVEKIDDKHKADISVEYTLHSKVENGTRHAVMNWTEFQKVAQHFIDCGKAEALEELKKNLANNDIYRVPEWLREVLVMAKDNGKKEALKDLPRWRVELGDMEYVAYGIIGGGVASEENPRVYLDGHSIDLYSLKKLPGFKEDEK